MGEKASVSKSPFLACWLSAAAQYNLPVDLLQAIGDVESGHNPTAVAQANNGTRSVGIMQVNSSWFPALADYGISEEKLFDPCINIRVGTWILAQEVERYGYNWEAIGAYYAGPYSEKDRHWKLKHYREYARKVIDRWTRRVNSRRQSDSAAD